MDQRPLGHGKGLSVNQFRLRPLNRTRPAVTDRILIRPLRTRRARVPPSTGCRRRTAGKATGPRLPGPRDRRLHRLSHRVTPVRAARGPPRGAMSPAAGMAVAPTSVDAVVEGMIPATPEHLAAVVRGAEA
ncbi:hypothetical protein GCM10022207_26470 [Streptomyces lannensis]|uniref:Uncharacterized protein n=1 Tax=Streptomyces lannensis TaxID=766498 RepID=A0ABP7K145_9ACTN